MPHSALLDRVRQFKGVWLNSNMPDITKGTSLHPLPESDTVTVASEDGTHERSVSLLGVLCSSPTLYRSTAFNGVPAAGGIEDPVASVSRVSKALRTSARPPDAIVALTHLLDEEDEVVCATGFADVVLGGHDHEVTNRLVAGTRLVKAGTDVGVSRSSRRWGAAPEFDEGST